jgi:AcrR family transcriptional regulator
MPPRLVETDAFAAVNVSSVAAAARVSRQTVYSIFGSREEMISEAITAVTVEPLQGVLADLDATETTSAYVVQLVVASRRELRGQSVLRALLDAERGKPLVDESMIGRAHQVAARLLEPWRARDPALRMRKRLARCWNSC